MGLGNLPGSFFLRQRCNKRLTFSQYCCIISNVRLLTYYGLALIYYHIISFLLYSPALPGIEMAVLVTFPRNMKPFFVQNG